MSSEIGAIDTLPEEMKQFHPSNKDAEVWCFVNIYGWVLIGVLVSSGDRTFELFLPVVARKWGVTWGLGELLKAPTKQTVLDPIGSFEPVVIERTANIFRFRMDVANPKWRDVCAWALRNPGKEYAGPL